MTDEILFRAINEAIWLRDNHNRLEREKLIQIISDIGKYEVFSARQLSRMIDDRLSIQTVSKALGKKDKTGGKLDPNSLNDIRDCLAARMQNNVNYQIVKGIVDTGTSQNMLSRLTGITQSEISRKMREG